MIKVEHLRDAHLDLPQEAKEALDGRRVEEEARKRLFYDEAMGGPFEVRGQEHRRVVGTHATHQTHSVPGSGRISFDVPDPTKLTSRCLSGCAICARSMWSEDLHEMDLFTAPDEAHQQEEVAEEKDLGERAPKRRFAVHPRCATKVNRLLSLQVYARRWPRIPKHELWASSLPHPHKPQWRWLLHTRRVEEPVLAADGTVPPVQVCQDCGYALSAEKPKQIFMPRYALANDNWIGRLPFPFCPGGEPLRDMEVKSLARGRMCVHKVIAEPERAGPWKDRQGGLVGNTIAFPQGKVEFSPSLEFPAPSAEAADFMSKTVIIALAGADVEDLHKAKWAEVRRQPYLDAATFLTRHNMFHGDMSVNEERAASAFAERGRTSDAVLQQAVPLVTSEELRHRLEGPADTGIDAGCVRHEQTVAVDGERVESEDEGELDLNAALPDEEFPADTLPPMHFCADELNSGDLDELQAIRRVHAELEKLQEDVRKDVEADVASGLSRRRVRLLKDAAKAMLDHSVADGIVRCGEEAKNLEEKGREFCAPAAEGYVQGTGSKPLSMYGPEQWASCFIDKFPYGDGVFGLARKAPLTFQQCIGLHLLREELEYQATRPPVASFFLLSFYIAASGVEYCLRLSAVSFFRSQALGPCGVGSPIFNRNFHFSGTNFVIYFTNLPAT